MDVKELRIGNWVNEKVHPGLCRPDELIPFQVKRIDWIAEGLGMVNGGLALKGIDPIPISLEILESCGFRKGIFRILIGSALLTIRGANNDTEVRLCDSDSNSISKYFKYLHQLQNLYFTLTGDELEVKLPVTA